MLNRSPRFSHRLAIGILAIQQLQAMPGKNARFGGRVSRHIRIAIQMILRDIQHGCDIRIQARRRFQLEAR